MRFPKFENQGGQHVRFFFKAVGMVYCDNQDLVVISVVYGAPVVRLRQNVWSRYLRYRAQPYFRISSM